MAKQKDIRNLYEAHGAFKTFKTNDTDEARRINSEISLSVSDCISFANSTLQQQWETNLKQYMRAPMAGDEKIKRRSKFVSNDVQERVDWFTAQTVSIFESQKSVVTFSPNTLDPHDKKLAEQQNKVLNFVLRDKNSHVATITPWFKNSALYGLGIVNVSFDEETIEGRLEVLQAVTDEQLVDLMDQREAGSIIVYEAGPDYQQELPDELMSQLAPLAQQQGLDPEALLGQAKQMLPMVRDIPIRRIKKTPRFKFTVVAVEDFIVSRDADFFPETGGVNAHVQGHRAYATKQELIQRGFNKELVNSISYASEKTDGVALERSSIANLDQGRSRRKNDVNVYEIYTCMALNDEDTPRHYRFTLAGDINNDPVLLGYEETSRFFPYAALVPYPVPNTLFGQGVADRVSNEQVQISKLTRAQIDNIHKVLDPTRVINPAVTNINDAINPQVGNTIRSEDPQAGVSFIQTPFVAQNAAPMIDALRTQQDAATGVGANMVSLSASDLADVTATGVKERKNSQQMLIEHVCYQFANTGYRYLAKCIIDLCVNKPDLAQRYIQKLTDMFEPFTIDEWDADMDVSTNVEFGLMDKEYKNQTLMNVLNLQIQAMEVNAATPQNIYSTLVDITENLGLQDVGNKFTDPQTVPQPEPQPTEAQVIAQSEQLKADLKAKADAAEREFEWNKLRVENDLARDRMAQDLELKKAEIEAKYRAQVDIARIQSEQQRTLNDVEYAMMQAENASAAQMQREQAQQAMMAQQTAAQQAPMQPQQPQI